MSKSETGVINLTREQKIGNRLRMLRGVHTLNEVAGALGVTRQAVSHYETGRRTPNDKMKVAIADYYGKTVQEIFFAD